MRMEKINSSTIKVTISNEELSERGVDLLSLLGDEGSIESFLYSILDEVDINDDFKSTGTITFQVLPTESGLSMYIRNKINSNIINGQSDDESGILSGAIKDAYNLSKKDKDLSDDKVNQMLKIPSLDEFKTGDNYSDDFYVFLKARKILKIMHDYTNNHPKLKVPDAMLFNKIQKYAMEIINSVQKYDVKELDKDKNYEYHLGEVYKARELANNNENGKDWVEYHNRNIPVLGEYDDDDDENSLNFWLSLSNFDDVVKLANAVKQYNHVESALYKYKGQYIMRFSTHYVLDQKPFLDYESTVTKAEEYGKQIHFQDSKLTKPNRAIIAEDAVHKLVKYFN